MKGPAVFVASLLAVAVLAAVLVRPALEEKDRLMKDRARSADGPTPAENADRIGRALVEAFGASPETWKDEIYRKCEEIATAADARQPLEITTSGVRLECRWDRLPDLLIGLAARPVPPLDSLVATPLEDAEWCRVEARFLPSADLAEGR